MMKAGGEFFQLNRSNIVSLRKVQVLPSSFSLMWDVTLIIFYVKKCLYKTVQMYIYISTDLIMQNLSTNAQNWTVFKRNWIKVTKSV